MYTRADFTQKYYSTAVSATKNTGIYPETLLAMAIVESSGLVNGKSLVGAGATARYANNYFGIKASPAWKGATISLSTPKDSTPISKFRKYDSIQDSFKDYVKFLRANKRYERAGVFDSPDYATQIINIARAGYAENTQYADVVKQVADKVAKTIEKLVIKPLNNNKGLTGAVALFFLSLIIYKSRKNESY